ncbi:hypothetical protein TYRP_023254 [Tyrophagus putrescentiae]|nr:hypothetical protein TYRP_023254 [Tyrophagus putrescentiae]
MFAQVFELDNVPMQIDWPSMAGQGGMDHLSGNFCWNLFSGIACRSNSFQNKKTQPNMGGLEQPWQKKHHIGNVEK